MSDRVRFPSDCAPAGAPVHTINELSTSASLEDVWAWLVDAHSWSSFYGNCKRMQLDGDDSTLGLGTTFHWTTFGLRVHTVVEEYEPPFRLAWRGGARGGSGYHGWVLVPCAEGCRIVTEETQRGPLPSIGRWVLRRALYSQHQRWLEGLARVAQAGPPPKR